MKIIAGVDEVGRGSLIGPVYAAAVILYKSIDKKLLKDSKSIAKNNRELLSNYIKKNSIWAIGKASVKEIDKINILQASLLAMKRAVKKLKKKPSHILIDGNKVPDLKNYKLKAVIKGDQKIPSINDISEELFVSRDTVEKAYNILKKKNIITSIRGKGSFVSRTKLVTKTKILFLANKYSTHKLEVFNSFINSLDENYYTDLRVYHCNETLFLNILEKEANGYDYYVVMPHFKTKNDEHTSITEEVSLALNKIPKNKLILFLITIILFLHNFVYKQNFFDLLLLFSEVWKGKIIIKIVR